MNLEVTIILYTIMNNNYIEEAKLWLSLGNLKQLIKNFKNF